VPAAPLRPRLRSRLRALAAALLAIVALPGAALANRLDWPPVSTNVPVCTSPGLQNYRTAISDGAGGMYVAWTDTRFVVADVYVQRIGADGTALWLTNGRLTGGAPGVQDQPTLVSDDAGGVIVVWRDRRYNVLGDIFAQRVDPNGNMMWLLNGLPVCLATDEQSNPVVVSDGTGHDGNPSGAIVAWEDHRSGVSIYAQHIDANGQPLWAVDGIPMTTSLAPQFEPAITADSLGGAYVAWSQQDVDYDVVAQHVDGSGDLLWDSLGVRVCGATGNQFHAHALAGGAGGTWFAWEDGRVTSLGSYVQRMNVNGLPTLTPDGIALSSGLADETDPSLASDGAGGVIAAWTDMRTDGDIYAQRVDTTGTLLWGYGGDPVCTAAGLQQFASVASDGNGGALVAWEDYRAGGGDIYSQRLGPDGSALWTPNGDVTSNAPGSQYQATVVSNPDSMGIVVWVDQRSNGNDLYAQQIPPPETAPLVTRLVGALSSAPNPAPGATEISFALPGAGRTELAIFDASGRRIRTVTSATLPAGGHTVPWDAHDDAGRPCAEGVYFARLAINGRTLATHRLTLRR